MTIDLMLEISARQDPDCPICPDCGGVTYGEPARGMSVCSCSEPDTKEVAA